MGNKENQGKKAGPTEGPQISLILESPNVRAGQQIKGIVVIKLDKVDRIIDLDEIVLNLVGFERFKFVRQNKKNKKEARTHKGGQEIFQKTKRVHESTLRLKKFDEIDKSEIRQQELQYTFHYSVPHGLPSSLEASPTEYCNFEVGYFLEAHLLPCGSNKDKRVSTSHQIQVISMPNI